MKITLIDRSSYFKGLILLIRKDRIITDAEVELLKRIGKTLGFESEFCDLTIHELLDNKYIVDTPPVFSTKELATKFIKDGLKIAFSDAEIHPLEKEWLRSAAEVNELDLTWFQNEYENILSGKLLQSRLELDDLTSDYI